jgi:hypothetical protein
VGHQYRDHRGGCPRGHHRELMNAPRARRGARS